MLLDLCRPLGYVATARGLNADDLSVAQTEYVYEAEQVLPDAGKAVPMFGDGTRVTLGAHEF